MQFYSDDQESARCIGDRIRRMRTTDASWLPDNPANAALKARPCTSGH